METILKLILMLLKEDNVKIVNRSFKLGQRDVYRQIAWDFMIHIKPTN